MGNAKTEANLWLGEDGEFSCRGSRCPWSLRRNRGAGGGIIYGSRSSLVGERHGLSRSNPRAELQ